MRGFCINAKGNSIAYASGKYCCHVAGGVYGVPVATRGNKLVKSWNAILGLNKKLVKGYSSPKYCAK